jgi:nicotinamidase-related amidase
MSKYFIKRDDAFLLVVDIQEKLFNVMYEKVQEILTRNASILLNSAIKMDIPVIVSEQYRKGLGPTIGELQDYIPDEDNYEKIHFDCTRDAVLSDAIEKKGKKTAIIAGIESHICVFQTAISLLDRGYTVVIASDAVASRRKNDWLQALAMLEKAGALVYPTETIVFMLLEKAGTPEFKYLSPLFK